MCRSSWADRSALPLVTVYNSSDGVSWHLDHGACGGPDSWQLYDGTIALLSTYCSGSHYRIALASPDTTRTGSFSGRYRDLPGLVDASALPVIVPWFARTGGDYYESTYDCAGSGRSLEISADGAVRLGTNYCVPSDLYGLTVGR